MFNTEELIKKLSIAIHEYTLPKCASCKIPYICCSKGYCETAQEYASREYGVDISSLRTNHPKLPFMGEKGCVVPHHLKPICTIHLCEDKWDERYARLRNVYSYLLLRRMRRKKWLEYIPNMICIDETQ